jgi:putative flippase GtrA
MQISDGKLPKIDLKIQLGKYLLGGLSTAILCWGGLFLFTEVFHIHYLASANMAGGGAFIYSYTINKFFVYRNCGNSHLAHGGKFTLLQMFLYALGNLLLYTGVDLCGFHYLWVIVLVAGMLSMINFIAMKHVVFT